MSPLSGLGADRSETFGLPAPLLEARGLKRLNRKGDPRLDDLTHIRKP
ncbi:MAG: hypothetical protein ACI8QC_000277 [Planctomycetota bacterium]|jgi:hypothetical protein